MKFIKSKLVQKADWPKKGKYHLTIEVTDYDIEMFEEFGWYPTAEVMHQVPSKKYTKMNNYLRNVFRKVFHRLWREYDD